MRERKRYRCTECGNIFHAEEPPATIPTSVVYCPRCDGLAESEEVWAEIRAKKPLTDKFDSTFLKHEDAYWAQEMDKWIENEVTPYIKGLEGKAEKLDAIETLMRGQHYINVNVMGEYSVLPELSHRGTKLVSAIMAILFPDDPDEEE